MMKKGLLLPFMAFAVSTALYAETLLYSRFQGQECH